MQMRTSVTKTNLFFSPPDKTLPSSPPPMRVLRLLIRPMSLSKRSIFSRTSEVRILLSSFILALKRIVEDIAHDAGASGTAEIVLYRKPNMLMDRHCFYEDVFLVHKATVMSHIRGGNRRSIHANITVHCHASCQFNKLRIFPIFFKIQLGEFYLRPVRNASAIISVLFPAPLRRVQMMACEEEVISIIDYTQSNQHGIANCKQFTCLLK